MIKNKDGEVCVGPSETLQSWHGHFEAVLNIRSEFNEGVAQALPQRPIRDELSQPPTEEKIWAAMRQLKSHKAGGKNGILPEMIKSCGPHIIDNM